MLEKEAQYYAFDEVKHKQEWYIKHPERSIDEDYEDIKKHWGKGAEFGYNKAKEEVKAPYPSYKHLFGESIEQTALRHSNDLINSLRGDIDYAKVIIQDLLNNSDEYARQRAMDFLKED